MRRLRLIGALALAVLLGACSTSAGQEQAPHPKPSLAPVGTNPFVQGAPYTPGSPNALQAAQEMPEEAAELRKVSAGTGALWVGNSDDSPGEAKSFVSKANAAGKTPVVVLYAIPNRDCGSHSAGGADGSESYLSWIDAMAAALDGTRVAVILEPDALAADCYDQERARILRSAVDVLSLTSATIYLDAGNSGWRQPSQMAQRLSEVGVKKVRGFAVNVSNFKSTTAERDYAEKIVDDLGGRNYVIDTSRNGARVQGWCNPDGARLGQLPAVSSAGSQDANLWIKTPGDSDGECNGGPRAGDFWADYAVQLGR